MEFFRFENRLGHGEALITDLGAEELGRVLVQTLLQGRKVDRWIGNSFIESGEAADMCLAFDDGGGAIGSAVDRSSLVAEAGVLGPEEGAADAGLGRIYMVCQGRVELLSGLLCSPV